MTSTIVKSLAISIRLLGRGDQFLRLYGNQPEQQKIQY